MEMKQDLSKREEKRTELFMKKAADLEESGYQERDLSMSIVKANVMALFYPVPLIAFLLLAYLLKQPFRLGGFAREYLTAGTSLMVSLIVLAGLLLLVMVHELLHGITWAVFAPGHLRDIEFGVAKDLLTPYCSCKSPLKKGQYLLGAFMPCLILGILPGIAGIVIGSSGLLLVSILMIFAAGGDLAVIAGVLFHHHVKDDALFFDHPYQCGVVVFER